MTPETIRDPRAGALKALRDERPEGAQAGGSVPVIHYLDEDRLAREHTLLRGLPHPVAVSLDLPTPGSWRSLDRFGTPLLLIRQTDGRLDAFLNVCRHGGTRLLPEGSGDTLRALDCPCHAWTYGLDGSLTGGPRAAGFDGPAPAAMGLRRLAVRERAGLVWVVPDPRRAAVGIDAHLGTLMDELERLEPTHPTAFAARSYEVTANWKLLIDESGSNRHRYPLKSNLDPENPSPRLPLQAGQPGNLAYFFFPNTTLLVQAGYTQLSTLEPTAVDRTRVHEITLIPSEPETEIAERHWQASVDLHRRTLAQEYAVAESIQRGLASGANEVLTFATFEDGTPRFHRQLDQALL